MYISFFFSHKGYLLLCDKTSCTTFCVRVVDNMRLEVVQGALTKKVELICFLLLNIISSNKVKKTVNFFCFKYTSNQVFNFITSFILVWLPLSIGVNLNSAASYARNGVSFKLKSFPIIDEFEVLFELNPSFLWVVKSAKVNVYFSSKFIVSSLLRESFIRLIKVPLKFNKL